MTGTKPYHADPQIVETWVKGWSIAREAAPPIKTKGGYRVDVGWPHQLVRYVFPRASKAFQHLADTIVEPRHFLKVCAPPSAVRPLLPNRWVIQPTGFMMTCFAPMATTNTSLPEGYTLEFKTDQPVLIVRVISENGDVAAIGRIVFVDGFTIYDRIETHLAHRRRGLGTVIMKSLETLARESGHTKSVLVATADGRALYESLGWQLHTLYTTAIIPEPVI